MRAGVSLGCTFVDSAQGFLANRPSHQLTLEPPPKYEVAYSVTVKGSVQADDLHVQEESITIRDESAGETSGVSIVLKPGQTIDVTGTPRPSTTAFARQFLGVGPDETHSLSQIIEERWPVSFLPSPSTSWLTLPRVMRRRLLEGATVKRLRLDSTTLRQDALTRELSRGFIGPAGEGLALAVDRLRGHNPEPSPRFRRILEQLNRVYPRIEDVQSTRIQPGRFVLRFKEKGIADALGQSNVSDGVLHSLALLLALNPTRERGVVAIEEPENAIHPWPLRQIISHAQTNEHGPLIITTHSPVVVDAIANTESLHVVELSDTDGTQVVRARDREQALDSILRESGMKLGEYWVSGGIGGVPAKS